MLVKQVRQTQNPVVDKVIFFFHFKVRIYRCLWREECPLQPKAQITGKNFCLLMTGFFLVKQKKEMFLFEPESGISFSCEDS